MLSWQFAGDKFGGCADFKRDHEFYFKAGAVRWCLDLLYRKESWVGGNHHTATSQNDCRGRVSYERWWIVRVVLIKITAVFSYRWHTSDRCNDIQNYWQRMLNCPRILRVHFQCHYTAKAADVYSHFDAFNHNTPVLRCIVQSFLYEHTCIQTKEFRSLLVFIFRKYYSHRRCTMLNPVTGPVYSVTNEKVRL